MLFLISLQCGIKNPGCEIAYPKVAFAVCRVAFVYKLFAALYHFEKDIFSPLIHFHFFFFQYIKPCINKVFS